MHSCPPQIFSGVSPAKFQALEATAAQAAGIPISGADGTAKGPLGITVTWHYDGEAQTLTIQCVDHPFFLSEATIETRIQDLIENTHEDTTLETAFIHQPVVHLGVRAMKRDSRTLQIKRYRTVINQVPPGFDWTGGVTDWGMFLNDRLGCCTIAGVGHLVQAWTLATSGKMVTVGDDIIQRYYSLWDGYVPGNPRTDRGGVELDVLNYMRQAGFAGHKLLAYADADPSDEEECADAGHEFGPLYIGMDFPERIIAKGLPDPQVPWTIDPTPSSLAGHCVIVVGKLPNGGNWKIVSWGQVYELTPDFFKRYVTEVHVPLAQDWIGAKGSPSGFDLDKLQHDIEAIR